MARLISFSMTEQQVRDRTKDVTRRLGWTNAKAGEELRAVRKVMGRKKGEPLVDLARIRVVSVRREPLSAITLDDVRREGYPTLSVRQFVGKFMLAMKCASDTPVTRIEFEYLAARASAPQPEETGR